MLTIQTLLLKPFTYTCKRHFLKETCNILSVLYNARSLYTSYLETLHHNNEQMVSTKLKLPAPAVVKRGSCIDRGI